MGLIFILGFFLGIVAICYCVLSLFLAYEIDGGFIERTPWHRQAMFVLAYPIIFVGGYIVFGIWWLIIKVVKQVVKLWKKFFKVKKSEPTVTKEPDKPSLASVAAKILRNKTATKGESDNSSEPVHQVVDDLPDCTLVDGTSVKTSIGSKSDDSSNR